MLPASSAREVPRTGADARSIAAPATPQPGKARALNLGYAHALPDRPVICLDADLSVTCHHNPVAFAHREDGGAVPAFHLAHFGIPVCPFAIM